VVLTIFLLIASNSAPLDLGPKFVVDSKSRRKLPFSETLSLRGRRKVEQIVCGDLKAPYREADFSVPRRCPALRELRIEPLYTNCEGTITRLRAFWEYSVADAGPSGFRTYQSGTDLEYADYIEGVKRRYRSAFGNPICPPEVDPPPR
jgi:hypothetical protein